MEKTDDFAIHLQATFINSIFLQFTISLMIPVERLLKTQQVVPILGLFLLIAAITCQTKTSAKKMEFCAIILSFLMVCS